MVWKACNQIYGKKNDTQSAGPVSQSAVAVFADTAWIRGRELPCPRHYQCRRDRREKISGKHELEDPGEESGEQPDVDPLASRIDGRQPVWISMTQQFAAQRCGDRRRAFRANCVRRQCS